MAMGHPLFIFTYVYIFSCCALLILHIQNLMNLEEAGEELWVSSLNTHSYKTQTSVHKLDSPGMAPQIHQSMIRPLLT